MTSDVIKQVGRRFYEELWNCGSLDAADELVAQDYVRAMARWGRAGQEAVAEKFRGLSPV